MIYTFIHQALEFLDYHFIFTAVHRLDRLVSGLLIFAKNAERAECFRQQVILETMIVFSFLSYCILRASALLTCDCIHLICLHSFCNSLIDILSFLHMFLILTLLQIEAGLLQKEYVAKVVGVFPDGEVCRLCSIHISFYPQINS